MKVEQREKLLLLSLLVIICIILALIFFWPTSSSEQGSSSGESSQLETESSILDSESSEERDSQGDSLEEGESSEETSSSTQDSEESTDSEVSHDSESSDESASSNESSSTNNSGSSAGSGSSENSYPVSGNPADDGVWNLLLVNPTTYLPENFTVSLSKYNATHQVDSRILDSLKAMLQACRAEGLDPQICSSYRDLHTQQVLYDRRIQRFVDQGYSLEDATKKAGTIVAVPGTSEHHTGLAVDIVANSNWNLDSSQEKTAEQKWLMAHCHEYGFILRYPNGRTDVTGIIYEPWHYRYVGVEHATYIMTHDITLEEYLELLNVGEIDE